MAAAIGGMIVSSIVSSVVNNAMSSMISNFGQNNVSGAMTNVFNDALGGALKDTINNSSLPQFLKNAANDAVDDILGKNQQPTSPEAQAGVDQSSFADLIRDAVMDMIKESEKEANEKPDGKPDGGGQSWLEVLAGSMADIQNKFLDNVMEAKEKLRSAAVEAGEDPEKGQADFIEAQNEYQAALQMFKQMSEISATTIKTIGEALATLARKQ